MDKTIGSLSDTLKELAGGWAQLSVLGSFVLYLLGYLSLRFHLTSFGIEADLTVVDERYVFAGARFLIHLMTSVPILVLILLLPAALIVLCHRLLPRRLRRCLADFFRTRATPARLATAGIVVSVLSIQLVMRQCFLMSNLLLRPDLPPPRWLQAVLLEESAFGALYFPALVLVTAAAAGLWRLALGRPARGPLDRPLTALLGFLLVVQLGLLPVNYGILIAGREVPRVAHLGDPGGLPEGSEAWLIWERRDSLTFLVRGREPDPAASPASGPAVDRERPSDHRRLLTVAREEVPRVEITCYDPILRILFRRADSPCL